MQTKKAKQLIQDACTQLQSVKGTLDQAKESAEKEQNKQNIINALNAVDNALNTANGTLQTYQD